MIILRQHIKVWSGLTLLGKRRYYYYCPCDQAGGVCEDSAQAFLAVRGHLRTRHKIAPAVVH